MQFFKMILNLFEGGEGGGTAGEASAPAAGEQTGDLSKVVYGKQEAPETPQDTQVDAEPNAKPEDRTQTYRNLIQGEYKDLYDSDVQKIVKGRLKDFDDLKKKSDSQQAIIDRLSAKYGKTDLQEIADALDNDSTLWEEEADKAGMTTEQYMRFQNLQRQNAALIREEQERVQNAQRQQQVATWMNEAKGVSQQYPEFDLNSELQNDRFRSMLVSGVPMADAYKVMHFDEFQNRTAQ